MVHEPNRPMDSDKPNPESPDTDTSDGSQRTDSTQSAEDLAQQLSTLRQELDSMRGKYLRALADCQNIQKRSAAERNEAVRSAHGEVAKALLPVLDNFDRTMEAAKDAKDVKAVADGVRIVYEQMLKALADFGLQRMDLKPGDPFDPVYHQAVAQQPTSDVEPEHILHVAQAGYMMRDRALRPAVVVVAKPVQQEPGEDGEVQAES